jgi:hypothetical protein
MVISEIMARRVLDELVFVQGTSDLCNSRLWRGKSEASAPRVFYFDAEELR